MKSLRVGVLLVLIIVAIVLIGMIAVPIINKPDKVVTADITACQHYDSRTIVRKVVAARTGEHEGFDDFSKVQDAAQKAHLLVDVDNASLSDNIWMVPFSQRSDTNGTQNGMALLDCSRDSVEFGGI
ncbi:hypothetical protein F3J37_01995 [Pantoea sp. Al-1710]|uniref:Uncharacterized protein n=1 Tax=Candidatus Pantoea communis TaxID=2608354 RepID=A0ABX0RIH7_9GAMM|nr:hypothetical protein [Pantoea communis]NIG17450.1 hypothetical protein [Pantoea communis]